ncbi:hypothetical protein ACOME3_009941 [Neoechinorhynchus agilis]
MEAAIRNFKYEAAFVGATTIAEKSDNVDHKLRNDVRIGTSKKRLMGLCFAHRNNQPMLHALAHGLNSRNQRLCAAFCKELDVLNGQGELAENLEWRATRRTALLASLKNRHFRQFNSSGWLSPDAISTLAGNGVSSFTSSYISSILAGGDGYAERLSEEWNRLMHSINGNSILRPYVPVGYQMTVETVQSADHVSKVVTDLAGNYSLFRTIPTTVFGIIAAKEPEFLHDVGLTIEQDDIFLGEKARGVAEVSVPFYKGKSVEEKKALHYYLCDMPHLAETHGPVCISLGLSYATSGPIGAEYNELWREEEVLLKPGTDLDPNMFHALSPDPIDPPTTISSGPCLDRVFSLILSDDLDTSARMDFTRLLHTVNQVAPLLRRRNEKMAYLTLCGSTALDHYRDGSPATFALLENLKNTTGIDISFEDTIKSGDDEVVFTGDWLSALAYVRMVELSGYEGKKQKLLISEGGAEFLQLMCDKNEPIPSYPLAPVLATYSSGNWYKNAVRDLVGLIPSVGAQVMNMVREGMDGEFGRQIAVETINWFMQMPENESMRKLPWQELKYDSNLPLLGWLGLRGRLALKEPKLKPSGQLALRLEAAPELAQDDLMRIENPYWEMADRVGQKATKRDRKARAYAALIRHDLDKDYCNEVQKQFDQAGIPRLVRQLVFTQVDLEQVERDKNKAAAFIKQHSQRAFARSRDRTLEVVCAKYGVPIELVRRLVSADNLGQLPPRERGEIMTALRREEYNPLGIHSYFYHTNFKSLCSYYLPKIVKDSYRC